MSLKLMCSKLENGTNTFTIKSLVCSSARQSGEAGLQDVLDKLTTAHNKIMEQEPTPFTLFLGFINMLVMLLLLVACLKYTIKVGLHVKPLHLCLYIACR